MFDIPSDLLAYLRELDLFIEEEIMPLQNRDDNIRFFDHRREYCRTDWDNGGLPAAAWEELLTEACALADAAGHYRRAWPTSLGGMGISNFWMAVIREHLASKGLGLFNDLQGEHSIVGNNPFVVMFNEFATPDQIRRDGPALEQGRLVTAFGLTEPDHGSDATFMETVAVACDRDGQRGWLINGEKMWATGAHKASHVMTFARTSGKAGDSAGITCFIVPIDAEGVTIEEYLWTFNMPTDHPRICFRDVWLPEDSYWGEVGKGLAIGQSFVHQNRIRQAASSLGAAVYCIEESVKHARVRHTFGQALAHNQAIQWPLIELATQAEGLRQLIRKTAWDMEGLSHIEIERDLSDKVSMCNFWANRLCCEAADVAMQVHGGIGYSRHKPFEHIYRHHRRYRITEGSEEIQMRKVGAYLFGYAGPRRARFKDYERDYAAARASGLKDHQISLKLSD